MTDKQQTDDYRTTLLIASKRVSVTLVPVFFWDMSI